MSVETSTPCTLSAKTTDAILRALQEMASSQTDDSLQHLRNLITALRPPKSRCRTEAPLRWAFFLQQIRSNQDICLALRKNVLDIFVSRRQVSFYTDSGLLPNTGFFTEFNRILMHKLLPEVRDLGELRQCISFLFSHPDTTLWLENIDLEERRAFWLLLELHADEDGKALHGMIEEMLRAALILSHRIAAMGLSPELVRVYPHLREAESPFVAMNVELIHFSDDFRRAVQDGRDSDDGKHLFVLIDQCEDAVHRAHTSASRQGTSMGLSFLLTRLRQHLERLTLLLKVMTVRVRPDAPDALMHYWTEFIFDALDGERKHNSLKRLFSDLISMLALRVTDNAARTGEHYIANSRSEWFRMLWQAAGAGVLIALLAMLKILGGSLAMSATAHTWLNGCIYASGFAIIYMLHFVIATKQPAMTAATLANSISQTSGRLRDTEKIVDLITDTFRSQLAAIAGNIFVAFPLAVAVLLLTGNTWVSPDKAEHLLQDLRPLASPALFYAAIAGIWLFVTGLVSGYLDNRAAYTQLGPRIAQLHWLRKLLGKRFAAITGHYISDHAGGLGGNIFFGMMLGLTPAFGSLTGLPLDIRHIAFSSANLGYALVALDFAVPPSLWLGASGGVLLIGAVNLSVSFALALWVAMRSRGVSFWLLAPVMPRLFHRLLKHPRTFFLPPR